MSQPRIIIACLFFSVASAVAQVRCVEDTEGNCIARGKLKTYTIKNSFGVKYDQSIRIGTWEFYSTEGNKIGTGAYKEKDKASYKHGEWLFYAEDGRLLFRRWYMLGTLSKTVFEDSGCYVYESERVCIVSDSLGGFKVTEKKASGVVEYKTAVKTEIAGDPSVNARSYPATQVNTNNDINMDSGCLAAFPMLRHALTIRAWSAASPLNLINNGDFELSRAKMNQNHESQIQMMNEQFARFWGSSAETPDIFQRDGNCFGGFRVMGVNYEVLRNQLKKPLEAGKTYCLQFKLRLKSENAFAFNGVSAAISRGVAFFRNSEEGRSLGVVLQTHPDMTLACRDQWMLISGNFKAKGGEKYIYISNFTDPAALKIHKVDKLAGDYVDEIYYYIDDVVLIEETADYTCPCNVKGCGLDENSMKDSSGANDIFVHPKAGQKLILRNIQFETAKWDLLESSYETLDSLVELMNKFPSMRVEIGGHTDNKGSRKDNEILSLNRAKAVVKFLVENGISESRLEYKGYGQEKPVDSNETEAGRLNNRRVEFVILEL